MCENKYSLKVYIPSLKVTPSSIHVANDITNISHNSCKYENSNQEGEASKEVFLHQRRTENNKKNKPAKKYSCKYTREEVLLHQEINQ